MTSVYGYAPPAVNANGEVNTFDSDSTVTAFSTVINLFSPLYEYAAIVTESGPLEIQSLSTNITDNYNVVNIATIPNRSVLFQPISDEATTDKRYNNIQRMFYSMPLGDYQNAFRKTGFAFWRRDDPTGVDATFLVSANGPSTVNSDQMDFYYAPPVSGADGDPQLHQFVLVGGTGGGYLGVFRTWPGFTANTAISSLVSFYASSTIYLVALSTASNGKIGWGISTTDTETVMTSFTVSVELDAADRVYSPYGLCTYRGGCRMVTDTGVVFGATGASLSSLGTLEKAQASDVITLVGAVTYDHLEDNTYAFYRLETTGGTVSHRVSPLDDDLTNSIVVTLEVGDITSPGTACMVNATTMAVQVLNGALRFVRMFDVTTGTVSISFSFPRNESMVSLAPVSGGPHRFWAWVEATAGNYELGTLMPSLSSPEKLLFYPCHTSTNAAEARLETAGMQPGYVWSRSSDTAIRLLSSTASFTTTTRRPGGYAAPSLVALGPDELPYEEQPFKTVEVQGSRGATAAIFYSPQGTLSAPPVDGWQITPVQSGGSTLVCQATNGTAAIDRLNGAIELDWPVESGEQTIQVVYTNVIKRDISVGDVSTFTPCVCTDGSGVGFLVPTTVDDVSAMQQFSLDNDTIGPVNAPTNLTAGPILYPIAANTLNVLMLCNITGFDGLSIVRLEYSLDGSVVATARIVEPTGYDTYTRDSYTASSTAAVWVSPSTGYYTFVGFVTYVGTTHSLNDTVDGQDFETVYSATSSGPNAAIFWQAASGNVYLSSLANIAGGLETTQLPDLPNGMTITASVLVGNRIVIQTSDGSFFANTDTEWTRKSLPQTVGAFASSGFSGGPTADTVLGWWQNAGESSYVYSLYNYSTQLRLPLSATVTTPGETNDNGCSPGSGVHMVDSVMVINGSYALHRTALLLAAPTPSPTRPPPSPVKPVSGPDAMWCAIIICLVFLIAGAIALPCSLKPV